MGPSWVPRSSTPKALFATDGVRCTASASKLRVTRLLTHLDYCYTHLTPFVAYLYRIVLVTPCNFADAGECWVLSCASEAFCRASLLFLWRVLTGALGPMERTALWLEFVVPSLKP